MHASCLIQETCSNPRTKSLTNVPNSCMTDIFIKGADINESLVIALREILQKQGGTETVSHSK